VFDFELKQIVHEDMMKCKNVSMKRTVKSISSVCCLSRQHGDGDGERAAIVRGEATDVSEWRKSGEGVLWPGA
jgi:hypothetical protein